MASLQGSSLNIEWNGRRSTRDGTDGNSGANTGKIWSDDGGTGGKALDMAAMSIPDPLPAPGEPAPPPDPLPTQPSPPRPVAGHRVVGVDEVVQDRRAAG